MRVTACFIFLLLLGMQMQTEISVESRLVFVDVIARDAHGHGIPGLQQSDFALSEDGKPQRVVFFEEHHAATAPAPHNAALDPGVVTNVAAQSADSDLNLLLFDLADTPVLDQPYARQQMIHFLQTLPPGHQVALFVLSDRLHFLQGFTGDSATLASAARLINVRELHLTHSEGQRSREAEDLAYFEQGLGGAGSHLADAVQEAVEAKSINDEKLRTQLVVDAFRSIAGSVSGYNGRKNLLWLSENFPVGLTDTLHTLRTGQARGTGVPAFDSIHAVSDGTVELLIDSQIAVYPIDVAGVETDAVGADLSGLGTAVAPNTTDPKAGDRLSGSFERRQFTRESMNRIAEATGGRAIYGTNDLSAAMTGIVSETVVRYTLAYRPTNNRFDGKVRQIRVVTPHRSLSLEYRHSYRALASSPAITAQPSSLVAAMQPGLPPATGLRLTATPESPGAASATVTVACSVDIHDVTLKEDSHGQLHGRLVTILAALPRHGDTGKQIPQTMATLNLNLDPDEYKTLLREGVRFEHHLEVPRGTTSLVLGVIDLTSGQIGTLTVPITPP